MKTIKILLGLCVVMALMVACDSKDKEVEDVTADVETVTEIGIVVDVNKSTNELTVMDMGYAHLFGRSLDVLMEESADLKIYTYKDLGNEAVGDLVEIITPNIELESYPTRGEAIKVKVTGVVGIDLN